MKRQVLLAMALCAPTTLATAQVKLPPYTREALPNGTVIYLLPRTGLPLVSFRVLVKGGAESEPASLAGLSAVTAELLRRGTAGHTAAQFSEDLDGLGGTFFAGTDEQSTSITAEFLQKDFDRGIALVSEAALHPAFPEDEVRKALSRRLDGLRSMKDNPGGAINSYYRSFFFGSTHPYGHVPDEASLDHIRRDDILAYHKRMYVGRNLIVIVAGDFDPAAAKARAAETFGAAPAGTAYAWMADQAPTRNTSPKVLLIDKPDATQTYFIIAQPGVRRATPDRVALMLVNTLFGGRFTSLLNEELRVKTGLTYGASSRVEMARLTGGLYISTYTKTETTEKAIDMALDILKRLQEKGITAEQLASAKAYTKGTYPPERLQTVDEIAQVLGEMELFGLGRDEVDQLFARVDAVTLDQANDAIKRYYRTGNLTFVLLGNASKIRDVAKKYGPQVVERTARQPGWAM
ncbi:Peptidase M16 domain protein [Candidatus Sulfopaludibacter sp. SbA4]|nr:Peptidase M16 domain protein [Candidatus Sulfopaludibacter sp. SbA4]